MHNKPERTHTRDVFKEELYMFPFEDRHPLMLARRPPTAVRYNTRANVSSVVAQLR